MKKLVLILLILFSLTVNSINLNPLPNNPVLPLNPYLTVLKSSGLCIGNQGAVRISYKVENTRFNAAARFTCIDPTGQLARPIQSVENRNIREGAIYTQNVIFANQQQPNGQLIQLFSGPLICNVRACNGPFCTQVNNIQIIIPKCID